MRKSAFGWGRRVGFWFWSTLWTLSLPVDGSMGLLAAGKEVKVAVSISIPPFFIKEIESGIEMEVIRHAFERGGDYRVRPIFFHAGPRLSAFEKREVDCASTIPSESTRKGHLSDRVITMETMAISLAEKKITVRNMRDLTDKHIIAFKGAMATLGEAFTGIVAENRHYRERLKNEIMPVLLYRKRVDLVLSDPMIFQYVRKKMASRVNIDQPIVHHRIFEPQSFSLLCHESRLIEAFNRGLAAIKASGLHQRIHDRFLQGGFPATDRRGDETGG